MSFCNICYPHLFGTNQFVLAKQNSGHILPCDVWNNFRFWLVLYDDAERVVEVGGIQSRLLRRRVAQQHHVLADHVERHDDRLEKKMKKIGWDNITICSVFQLEFC